MMTAIEINGKKYNSPLAWIVAAVIAFFTLAWTAFVLIIVAFVLTFPIWFIYLFIRAIFK